MSKRTSDIARRRFIALAGMTSATILAGCNESGEDGSAQIDGNDGDSQTDNNGEDTGSNGNGGHDWVYDQEQESDPDFIRAWNLGSEEADPATAETYERYTEETGVDVEVRAIPPGDVLSQARSHIQSESTDVDVWTGDWPYVLDLGAQGALEELGAFIPEENSEGWVDGAKKSCQMPIAENNDFADFPYRDGIYGTPWFASGWTCWTNKDVLEEAGYDREAHPETFSEFREMAEQIADVGGVEYPVQFPFSGFISGLPIMYDLTVRSGGHFFDGGDPDFENEGFIQAADFLLGLVNDGLASQGVTSLDEGQATTTFFEGKAGLQFQVASNMFLDTEELPIDRPPEEVAQINLYPTPDDIGFDETPTGNLFEVLGMIPIYSERKEPAAEALEYIASQEGQALQLGIEGNMPLRTDVFETEIVQENVPDEYIEPMMRHLEGIDKLVHQQPARVADTVLQQMQAGIGEGASGEQVASAIQQEVQGYVE